MTGAVSIVGDVHCTEFSDLEAARAHLASGAGPAAIVDANGRVFGPVHPQTDSSTALACLDPVRRSQFRLLLWPVVGDEIGVAIACGSSLAHRADGVLLQPQEYARVRADPADRRRVVLDAGAGPTIFIPHCRCARVAMLVVGDGKIWAFETPHGTPLLAAPPRAFTELAQMGRALTEWDRIRAQIPDRRTLLSKRHEPGAAAAYARLRPAMQKVLADPHQWKNVARVAGVAPEAAAAVAAGWLAHHATLPVTETSTSLAPVIVAAFVQSVALQCALEAAAASNGGSVLENSIEATAIGLDILAALQAAAGNAPRSSDHPRRQLLLDMMPLPGRRPTALCPLDNATLQLLGPAPSGYHKMYYLCEVLLTHLVQTYRFPGLLGLGIARDKDNLGLVAVFRHQLPPEEIVVPVDEDVQARAIAYIARDDLEVVIRGRPPSSDRLSFSSMITMPHVFEPAVHVEDCDGNKIPGRLVCVAFACNSEHRSMHRVLIELSDPSRRIEFEDGAPVLFRGQGFARVRAPAEWELPNMGALVPAETERPLLLD